MSDKMKRDTKDQFPGKMDKLKRNKVKTTYPMGYKKLKNVKLYEEFTEGLVEKKAEEPEKKEEEGE